MNSTLQNKIFKLGDQVQVNFMEQHYHGEIVDCGYNDEQWKVATYDGGIDVVHEDFLTLIEPDSNE